MNNAIPNPKKSFQLDFPQDKIFKSLDNIPTLNRKYTIVNKDEILKIMRLDSLEFLSLGVYVDITLSSISDERTNVDIEVLRKIGAFDQSFEVQKANQHIQTVASLISQSLTLTPDQLDSIKNGSFQSNGSLSDKPTQSKLTMILVCLFAGNLGIHRYLMGYSNWWLQLITLGGCGIWSLIDLIQIATGSMKMADGRELTA